MIKPKDYGYIVLEKEEIYSLLLTHYYEEFFRREDVFLCSKIHNIPNLDDNGIYYFKLVVEESL